MKRHRVRYYYAGHDGKKRGVLVDVSVPMTKARAEGIVEHVRMRRPKRHDAPLPGQLALFDVKPLTRRERLRLRGLHDIELITTGKPPPLKHNARRVLNLEVENEQLQLSKKMKRLLAALRKRGGRLGYATLQRSLRVSSQSLSRTVRRLAERGLVVKEGTTRAPVIVLVR